MNERTRIAPEVFSLPLAEIRRGYRSATYFWRTKKILEAEQPDNKVVMQVFQKYHSILCGVDEAIAVLEGATGHWENQDKVNKLFDDYLDLKFKTSKHQLDSDFSALHTARSLMTELEQELDLLWVNTYDELDIEALYDGDAIEPWEPVMHIRGPLSQFAHLESVYLGILARRTKVATNTRRVVEAANGKPVLFFADRFDDYHCQGGDGYAAHIGGTDSVATDAMGRWYWNSGMGTMPHALIAACNGSTTTASLHFHNHYPDVPLIALVDFNNDCVTDSIKCYNSFGKDLYGVRLDTSENMVDAAVARSSAMGDFKPTGVNVKLVELVRKRLNEAGAGHVKIFVSGGFNPTKIAEFESVGAPVDAYAVGSSLLANNIDYTADIVWPKAKEGRKMRHSDRLELVNGV